MKGTLAAIGTVILKTRRRHQVILRRETGARGLGVCDSFISLIRVAPGGMPRRKPQDGITEGVLSLEFRVQSFEF